MEQHLISIIVTCYNRDPYILDCLKSVKTQTYINFQCIIVDDGSTDNSVNLIRNFISDDPRFTLIASEHVGFPQAKNIGLANVKGDYTIFLDSDDIAHPSWLFLLHYITQVTGAEVAVCSYDTFSKTEEIKNVPIVGGKPLPMSEFSFLRHTLFYNAHCMHFMWNKLVRSDLYNGIVCPDQMALSDVAVMGDIADKAKYIVWLRLPLVHYRQHNENMGKTSQAKGAEYWAWRLKFQKGCIRKDWNRAPQCRLVLQLVLRQEIKYARDFFKDDFDKYCTVSDVQDILTAKLIGFTEQ